MTTATERAQSDLAELWRLAWPTMLSRAGILSMALVDVIMVGRFDAGELAFAALGISLFVPVLVTGVGLLLGVMVLASQAFGAGRHEETAAIWARALPWGGALGLVGATLCLFGETWLRLFGQTPELAAGGGAVAHALAIAVPAQLIYVACAFYLEATRRPRPAMMVMLIANILNVALNWILIYGELGAPALGAFGSAIATSAVRVFLAVALLVYILSLVGPEAGRIRGALRRGAKDGVWGPGGWAAGAEMRRLGLAAGVSFGIETCAYSMLTQMSGWIGERAAAAFAIAYNIESFLFMAALGLGGATAVLVGNAVGRADGPKVVASAWLGLRVTILGIGAVGVLIILAAPWVAWVHAPDPSLAAWVADLLWYVALLALLDAAQLVMGQSVRALGDAWGATRIYAIAFLAAMLPSAYVLAFPLGFGVEGLLIGGMVGGAVSLALQMRRFDRLTRDLAASWRAAEGRAAG